VAVQKSQGVRDSIGSRVLAGIRDKDLEIPTLPESSARIEMISEDETIDLREFVGALARDPGVASQIIQIANSPPNGGERPVGSLGVAIKQLGLRYASELAAGLSSRLVFQPTNEMIERRYRQAIHDATFVGAAAAVFARNYTELSAERARLAGLVHNIGVFPILAQAEYENFTDTFALGTIVDAVHVVLSASILKRWNFPKEVFEIPQRIAGHQRADVELGLLDLVTVAVQLNRYFNHSESDTRSAGDNKRNAAARAAMSQPLSRMIYEIAGFDPLSNPRMVAILKGEISAEFDSSVSREM